MPVISIIVPVYKTEKYFHRCIDSILKQTFIDFECILIDDGSPDNCPALCDEYAMKDSRIVVIHQMNSGVSAARNAGLDIARGEWIGFVDSDDWCDSDMFQVLYDNALKCNADVSICGYREITSGKIIGNVRNKIQIFDAKQARKKLFSTGRIIGFNPANWNKLINAKIIFQNKLRYDTTMQLAEDFLFLYEVLRYTRKIVLFSRPYYNYFDNPESVTNQFVLTNAGKILFFAFDKMILLEDSKIIKRRIIVTKVIYALNLCHYFIVQRDYTNENFYLFKKFVINSRDYLLFDFSTPLYIKINCYLICNPQLYILVRNFLNHIKHFWQGVLKIII